MRKRTLTPELLELFRNTFEYNADRGRLLRNGLLAGSRHPNGHLTVRANYTVFMVHHVVWALHYGKFPDRTLVHRNGNKRDNRLSNLVEAGFGPKATHVSNETIGRS